MGEYFGWNFKGCLWNSTQNISPMHWKMQVFYNAENLRALRFKGSYAVLKCPLVVPPSNKNYRKNPYRFKKIITGHKYAWMHSVYLMSCYILQTCLPHDHMVGTANQHASNNYITDSILTSVSHHHSPRYRHVSDWLARSVLVMPSLDLWDPPGLCYDWWMESWSILPNFHHDDSVW